MTSANVAQMFIWQIICQIICQIISQIISDEKLLNPYLSYSRLYKGAFLPRKFSRFYRNTSAVDQIKDTEAYEQCHPELVQKPMLSPIPELASYDSLHCNKEDWPHDSQRAVYDCA